MFVGHYAVAFAVKKAAPKVSLGTLFLAAQFVDLLWPLLLLVGLEHVRIDPGNTILTPIDFYDYPISHSFIAAIVWSGVLGFLIFSIKRDKKSSFVVGLCVFSHWILDFITHRPDLPLAFDKDMYFGLGLWNSPIGTILIELGLFMTGTLIYVRATKSIDRVGVYGFWSLLSVLLLIYVSNFLGPPPPNEFALAIVANAAWLFVIWAYWVDRHRIAVLKI
ncbi:hypothetical protein F9K33_09185 [bacterium]|nr:MAG: hypothetical protein F9K33_09185 [bacterium]